jgi:hypothetical protein
MHEVAIVDSYVVVCSKWRQVALVGTPDIDPWPNCKGLSGKIGENGPQICELEYARDVTGMSCHHDV